MLLLVEEALEVVVAGRRRGCERNIEVASDMLLIVLSAYRASVNEVEDDKMMIKLCRKIEVHDS